MVEMFPVIIFENALAMYNYVTAVTPDRTESSFQTAPEPCYGSLQRTTTTNVRGLVTEDTTTSTAGVPLHQEEDRPRVPEWTTRYTLPRPRKFVPAGYKTSSSDGGYTSGEDHLDSFKIAPKWTPGSSDRINEMGRKEYRKVTPKVEGFGYPRAPADTISEVTTPQQQAGNNESGQSAPFSDSNLRQEIPCMTPVR
jgi:hypothetical protein